MPSEDALLAAIHIENDLLSKPKAAKCAICPKCGESLDVIDVKDTRAAGNGTGIRECTMS